MINTLIIICSQLQNQHDGGSHMAGRTGEHAVSSVHSTVSGFILYLMLLVYSKMHHSIPDHSRGSCRAPQAPPSCYGRVEKYRWRRKKEGVGSAVVKVEEEELETREKKNIRLGHRKGTGLDTGRGTVGLGWGVGEGMRWVRRHTMLVLFCGILETSTPLEPYCINWPKLIIIIVIKYFSFEISVHDFMTNNLRTFLVNIKLHKFPLHLRTIMIRSVIFSSFDIYKHWDSQKFGHSYQHCR